MPKRRTPAGPPEPCLRCGFVPYGELHVCRWLDANGNPASPALVREMATRFWVGVRQDRLELEARQAAGDLDSEREG